MGGLPALLVVLCAGGMCKYCFRPLAFALNPLLLLHALQKWHLGCLVFLYLVHNLPQLLLQAVIFSLLQFVCIFLLEEVCPSTSIAAKGPRFQPVSFAAAVRRACTPKAKL